MPNPTLPMLAKRTDLDQCAYTNCAERAKYGGRVDNPTHDHRRLCAYHDRLYHERMDHDA